MTTWIAVTERLPERGEHVLLCDAVDGSMTVGYRAHRDDYRDHPMWRLAQSGAYAEDDDTYATHWQPLPAPPEKT